ncbi:MAG TPA: DUF1579 domain-containing protein [Blastocatellia bacterium]|nr:DUF1579 domain-containing protein [Blastocatellia bacterium]
MRLRLSLCVIALITLLAAMAGQALAQGKQATGKDESTANPEMQEMMKKWMDAATPGSHHKALEHFIGKWDTTCKVWMEGPGKPPSETKGTSEVRWILGGRYTVEELKSQMLGMPHSGMGITGYDNFKKQYVGFWIDNMSTAMFTTLGEFDSSGKVLTSTGKMDEPMTGEKDKLVKYVIQIIDKDKHVFSVYDLAGTSNEFKVVEITYTRKK